MKTLGLNPPTAELDRIRRHFRDPGYDTDLSDDIDLSDPNFEIWVRHNVAAHKQHGYAIATISLKPVGGSPGDASADQIALIADLAKQRSEERRVGKERVDPCQYRG